MQFSLALDRPKNELSGFTSHAATLIWRNRYGNDCTERFHKRKHEELMHEVILFMKNRGHAILSLDLSDFENKRFITFYTT